MTTSASKEWRESAKSLCNYANQHEKTAVMKGLCRSLYAPATEQQLSSQVVALFHDRENISVVIKICAQPTYSGIHSWTPVLSFCINSKLFIIELYFRGDRKALIQHVPMTEAKLLIFPELFFTSPDKSQWGGLSRCVREECAVLCGTECTCLFCPPLSLKLQLLEKDEHL